AIVRSFGAREGKGHGATEVGDRGRPRRCAQCGLVLMNGPMAAGAGGYFDGITSTRHDVLVLLKPAGLQISGHDGHPLNEWPYADLEELSAPASLWRRGRRCT